VIRIVPLYFVLTTLMVIFLLWRFDGDLAASDNSWQSILASYFFWPFRRTGDAGTAPVLAVGWTLNYEMFFYTVFATVVWLSRSRAVLCAVAALVILVAMGYRQIVPDPYSVLADPIVLEFTYGALIALVYRSGVRIPAAATIVLCTVAIAAFVWSGIYGLGNHPRWLAWGIPSALLVGGFVLCRRELTTVSTPLSGLLLLGDASYALYLTHGFSLAASRHALGLINPAMTNPAVAFSCAVVMMIVCIAGAVVVHLYFERPMTVALQRRLKQRMDPGMRQSVSALNRAASAQSSDVKSLA
jgi:peptidoglycan/LPS O-acetylase OafA/YrhL